MHASFYTGIGVLNDAKVFDLVTKFCSKANISHGDVTDTLNEDLASVNTDVLINLASNEYFKAVKPKGLKADVITPQFKDLKNGQYKMISFFAKKARGVMARYVIDNRITDPEALKAFNGSGYYFSEEHSQGPQWVFLRDEAPV